jgi:hypothetical protein
MTLNTMAGQSKFESQELGSICSEIVIAIYLVLNAEVNLH